MTDFEANIEKLGWTRKRLAEELGVTTETLRVWCKYGPSKAAVLAVQALVDREHGPS